jgi:hypothetical protein
MSSNRSRRISPISTTPKLLPAALPSAGETSGSRTAAAPERCASALGRVVCAGAHWRRAARGGPFPRTEAPPAPLSLIPIRLALPMTAFRDPTPSAAEMWLALFPSRASFLRSSTASAVHSIACSNRCRCGVPPRGIGGYSCPSRTRRRASPYRPANFGRISNLFSILKKRIKPQSPIWNSPTGTINTV